MFGFSIFLNESFTDQTKYDIEAMAQNGFSGIFTSLHIPEEDTTQYRKRLIELGAIVKREHLTLMVDISGDALNRAGFSFERVDELKEIGVTGLRMDYHISNQQIAELSKVMTIALNASTITEADIQELSTAKANFNNLEAWHNYYPRPETALDKKWYHEKNQWLKTYGFTLQGFVPGNEKLRGPLYQGLPTLEEHRHMSPLAAALDLVKDTDKIYIGDSGLSRETMKQFSSYIKDETINLRVEAFDPQINYVLGEHINRQDEARDVIRSAKARFNEIPVIRPLSTKKRSIGAVTIDNEKYGRYMGEIQIMKRLLTADEKVNVVGQVIKEDRILIQHIKAGQKFSLESVEKND
ncbi:DUF871 domain-containing protein [Enterococcus dongliensis]|uniref:DUF871 domain-containing protein n=1 Tax=Enterococcus dongliensis TaxID=2559925 RepID=UPI00288E9020|nr:MupG family TIM beta-alpha barrel fold protein [Enterococcus dongliensis]MDT2614488.1 MupG family TIM beta-alpha barrel fold protein [Enterococcus dongliensis]